MRTPPTKILLAIVAGAILGSAPVWSQVGNLRITEVRPFSDQVVVTNTGGDFTAATAPFLCRRPTYIALATNWTAGQSQIINVSLSDTSADAWVYEDGNFGSSSSIIHGLVYGAFDPPGIDRVSVAVAAGIWPNDTDAFVPTPSSGQVLVYDGAGFAPSDWTAQSPGGATPTPTSPPPTATPTNTEVPPTSTPTNTDEPATATPTNTEAPPTATATDTTEPATATPTGEVPTPTETETAVEPTSTPTDTPVEATATETPLAATATATPESATPTFTPTYRSANLDGLDGVDARDLLLFILQWQRTHNG